MVLHVSKDFLYTQRFPTCQLFEIICKNGHLAFTDCPAEGNHAVTAEGEIRRGLRPHILRRPGNADGIKEGMTVEAIVSDAPSTDIMDYMTFMNQS